MNNQTIKTNYETPEEIDFLYGLFHAACKRLEEVLFSQDYIKITPVYALLVIKQYRQLNQYLGAPDHNKKFLDALEKDLNSRV